MKKQLLFLIMIMLPLVASADAVEINGIYYSLYTDGNVAEVTSNPNQYTGSIVIPETVVYQDVSFSVTSIGDGAFRDCTSLTSITIPNSVTSIRGYAFYNCNGLTSIIIPDNVTSIGGAAFQGCSNLIEATISSSLEKLDYGAFAGCGNLIKVNLSNKLTSIGGYAFSGCSSLDNITLPKSLTIIGRCAFEDCKSLTEIIIPNGLTSLNYGTFEHCSNLKSITIPPSINAIDEYVFLGCAKLKNVYIDDIVAWCNINFKETEFAGSRYVSNPLQTADHLYLKEKEIHDIYLPDGIEKINQYVFYGFDGLNSVVIPNSVISIEKRAFSNCPNLTNVSISDEVNVIEEECFSVCKNLNAIKLPAKLNTIRRAAFAECAAIKSIILPEQLQYIYGEAFANCKSLNEVKCYAVKPPLLYENSFSKYNTLYVPKESISDYQNTTPWNNFVYIKSLDEESPTTPKCNTPIISYKNGVLEYSSDTENAEFHYVISSSDMKEGIGKYTNLSVIYNVSVYASKDGFLNSDVATATLCWIDASPKTEGITNGVAQIAARPVLVKTDNGFITVEGVDDRTNVSVYTTDGKQVGSTISQNNIATIATSIQPGSIAIVKVGDKAVKVVIK